MRTRVIFFASALIVPCSARRGWLDCTVMARFGFVRACARSQVAVGILFMVLGPVAAGAALLWWPAELFARVPAEWRGFVPPPAALAGPPPWLALRPPAPFPRPPPAPPLPEAPP